MNSIRYLPHVATLVLDSRLCIGCSMCTTVCPHNVYAMARGKARIADLDGCMECGACAANCPAAAISLTPGVGCAAYILQQWFKRRKTRGGC